MGWVGMLVDERMRCGWMQNAEGNTYGIIDALKDHWRIKR